LATIKAAIALYDGFSSPLNSMNKVLNTVLSSFEAMQSASGNAVDVQAIRDARLELARAEVSLDGIEQNIRNAGAAQQRFNNDIRNGSSDADGLWSKMKGIAATVGGMVGVKKIMDLSDQLSNTRARLNFIVDDGGSVAELEAKIRASAQRSRAAYQTTADAVAKLGMQAGDAFSSNDELIAFTEQLNKGFAIAGADSQAIDSVMYNLTQGLASGALRGQDLNEVLKNAPNIIQNIADYLDVPLGKIKEMAAAGELTAGVVVRGVLAATEETNAAFEAMATTWAQIWVDMKDRALLAFEPILNRITEIGNSDRFAVMSEGIINGLTVIAAVATQVFDIMISIGSAIVDNWSWISPIIWGIVAAFVAYKTALLLWNAVQTISNGLNAWAAFQEKVKAAAVMMSTGATFAATAAQYGLNAALYACPVTWILVAIIGIIAVLYAAVAAVNHFAGKSVSATGIVAGAFMVALAFIGNLFVGFWNLIVDIVDLFYNTFVAVANFFGNLFVDPIGAICRLFFDMADTVLGILEALAGAIDALFGSNLAGAVSGWRGKLGGWVDSTFGSGIEIMSKVNSSDLKLKRFEYTSAFNTGYGFGQGLENKISNAFKPNIPESPYEDAFGGAGGMANTLDGINGNTGNTAGNTAAMANSLDYMEEDLAYMRDIAEREVVNRFTTAEITIYQDVANTITSDTDVDGVINKLAADFVEQVNISAEGVHT